VNVPAAAEAALAEILGRDDPAIVGVVLTGSAARGMANEHSDVDVYVVLPEGAKPRRAEKSRFLDELPVMLNELEAPNVFGTEGWWNRWSFAWAQVLRDDTGGRVRAAVRRQATLDEDEQRNILTHGDRLDGWLNFAYRAAKSTRDGRPRESRFDAAESVPWLLDVIFTLSGRVRPYTSTSRGSSGRIRSPRRSGRPMRCYPSWRRCSTVTFPPSGRRTGRRAGGTRLGCRSRHHSPRRHRRQLGQRARPAALRAARTSLGPRGSNPWAQNIGSLTS
jgi:predicted nucleotidyltransferase